MENQVRVCENEAVIVGRLKEKKINFNRTAEGKVMATGYLVLATENQYGKGEVRVSVMQNALTKDNKENSLYKGLVTVDNEYKSLKETGDIETADLIKITGSLNDETYYSVKKGEFVEKIGTRATFVNRIERVDKSGETVEDKVNVALEGYIAEIKPANDELEVKFITIGYGGVAVPVTAFVPKELVVPFQGRHQVGQTTTLYIAIVNTVETTKVEKEVGFGVGFGEKIERTIIKNIIFGGGAINYNQAYTQDQVRQALALREVKLEEKKTKAIEKEAKKGNNGSMTAGFGAPQGGFTVPQGNASPQGGFGTPINGGFSMPTGGFGV